MSSRSDSRACPVQRRGPNVPFTSFPVRRVRPYRLRQPAIERPVMVILDRGSASLPTLIAPMRPTGPGQAPSPTEGPPAPATPRPVIRPRLSAKPARSLASPASSVRSTDKPASEPATRITAHRQRLPFAIRSISLGVERPGLSFADGVWRWRPRWQVGGPPALAQADGSLAGSALYYPRKLL